LACVPHGWLADAARGAEAVCGAEAVRADCVPAGAAEAEPEHAAAPRSVAVRAPSTHAAHLIFTGIVSAHSRSETVNSGLNISGLRIVRWPKRADRTGFIPSRSRVGWLERHPPFAAADS